MEPAVDPSASTRALADSVRRKKGRQIVEDVRTLTLIPRHGAAMGHIGEALTTLKASEAESEDNKAIRACLEYTAAIVQQGEGHTCRLDLVQRLVADAGDRKFPVRAAAAQQLLSLLLAAGVPALSAPLAANACRHVSASLADTALALRTEAAAGAAIAKQPAKARRAHALQLFLAPAAWSAAAVCMTALPAAGSSSSTAAAASAAAAVSLPVDEMMAGALLPSLPSALAAGDADVVRNAACALAAAAARAAAKPPAAATAPAPVASPGAGGGIGTPASAASASRRDRVGVMTTTGAAGAGGDQAPVDPAGVAAVASILATPLAAGTSATGVTTVASPLASAARASTVAATGGNTSTSSGVALSPLVQGLLASAPASVPLSPLQAAAAELTALSMMPLMGVAATTGAGKLRSDSSSSFSPSTSFRSSTGALALSSTAAAAASAGGSGAQASPARRRASSGLVGVAAPYTPAARRPPSTTGTPLATPAAHPTAASTSSSTSSSSFSSWLSSSLTTLAGGTPTPVAPPTSATAASAAGGGSSGGASSASGGDATVPSPVLSTDAAPRAPPPSTPDAAAAVSMAGVYIAKAASMLACGPARTAAALSAAPLWTAPLQPPPAATAAAPTALASPGAVTVAAAPGKSPAGAGTPLGPTPAAGAGTGTATGDPFSFSFTPTGSVGTTRPGSSVVTGASPAGASTTTSSFPWSPAGSLPGGPLTSPPSGAASAGGAGTARQFADAAGTMVLVHGILQGGDGACLRALQCLCAGGLGRWFGMWEAASGAAAASAVGGGSSGGSSSPFPVPGPFPYTDGPLSCAAILQAGVDRACALVHRACATSNAPLLAASLRALGHFGLACTRLEATSLRHLRRQALQRQLKRRQQHQQAARQRAAAARHALASASAGTVASAAIAAAASGAGAGASSLASSSLASVAHGVSPLAASAGTPMGGAAASLSASGFVGGAVVVRPDVCWVEATRVLLGGGVASADAPLIPQPRGGTRAAAAAFGDAAGGDQPLPPPPAIIAFARACSRMLGGAYETAYNAHNFCIVGGNVAYRHCALLALQACLWCFPAPALLHWSRGAAWTLPPPLALASVDRRAVGTSFVRLLMDAVSRCSTDTCARLLVGVASKAALYGSAFPPLRRLVPAVMDAWRLLASAPLLDPFLVRQSDLLSVPLRAAHPTAGATPQGRHYLHLAEASPGAASGDAGVSGAVAAALHLRGMLQQGTAAPLLMMRRGTLGLLAASGGVETGSAALASGNRPPLLAAVQAACAAYAAISLAAATAHGGAAGAPGSGLLPGRRTTSMSTGGDGISRAAAQRLAATGITVAGVPTPAAALSLQHAVSHLPSTTAIVATARLHETACRALLVDIAEAHAALTAVAGAFASGYMKPRYARTLAGGPLTARAVAYKLTMLENIMISGWRCTGEVATSALAGTLARTHAPAAPATGIAWYAAAQVGTAAPSALGRGVAGACPLGDRAGGLVTPAPFSSSGLPVALPKSSLGLVAIDDDFGDSSKAAWERVLRRLHRGLGAAAITTTVLAKQRPAAAAAAALYGGRGATPAASGVGGKRADGGAAPPGPVSPLGLPVDLLDGLL